MQKYRIMATFLVALILVAGLSACSSSNNGQNDDSTVDENTVLMENIRFQPAQITISAGETITWINRDSAGHDVVSDLFDSGTMRNGQTFSYTYNETGTFDYYCSLHPGMNGKVIVE